MAKVLAEVFRVRRLWTRIPMLRRGICSQILNQPQCVKITRWCKFKGQMWLRVLLFHPNRHPKALNLDTTWGWFKIEYKIATSAVHTRDLSWPETHVSVAAFRIIRVGRQSADTLTYPALVCSSPLALLLFCVLAQQGPHLLLVIKGTGMESGLQPSSILEQEDKNTTCGYVRIKSHYSVE